MRPLLRHPFLLPEVPAAERRQVTASRRRSTLSGAPSWSLLPLAPNVQPGTAPDLDPTPWEWSPGCGPTTPPFGAHVVWAGGSRSREELGSSCR